MQILDLDGKVLFEEDVLNETALVEMAAKRQVRLYRANLKNWYLAKINLKTADLRGADLRGAVLRYCDLRNVTLEGANLEAASLESSMLENAFLDGANFKNARLPSPTMMLLAWWNELSDQLTADLMLWDSLNHPDPNAFDRWAKDGICPYITYREVSRAANFREKSSLWGKGKECRPYDLMKRVLAEKCPDWTDEQLAKFSK